MSLSLQNHIIRTLHTQPHINVEQEVRYRTMFLADILRKSKAQGYVVGISGGQDSTLTGKLAQLAVEQLRAEGHEAQFHALLLPYNEQADIDDAKYVAAEFIQADNVHQFNIRNTVDAFTTDWDVELGGKPLSDFNKGNLKARVRMMTQYAYAGEKQLLVLGTSNAAENLTGFATKHGDAAYDVSPIGDLNKRQGRMLLEYLNAPEWLLQKTPTADLLDGIPAQADEAELGVTYDTLDDFLEGKIVNDEAVVRIEHLFLKSGHKREGAIKY